MMSFLTSSHSPPHPVGLDSPNRLKRGIVSESAVAGDEPVSVFRKRHARLSKQRDYPFSFRMSRFDQHDPANKGRIPSLFDPSQIPRPAPQSAHPSLSFHP